MAITSPSAPPAKKTRGTSSAASKAAVNAAPLSGKAAGYYKDLAGLGQLVSVGLIIRGQFADAGALSVHGPKVFEEVARIAALEERVGKILDYLGNVGPYAGLITAVIPLALQIMVNHKAIQVMPGTMGVVPPEQLEADVRTALARQKADAIRAQREAEAELKALLDGENAGS